MKRVGWAALVTALLCALGAVLWLRFGGGQLQSANVREHAQLPGAEIEIENASEVRPASAPPQPQDAPSPERKDYAAQFRAAPDFLEFARSLLGAARAGDHAAQFYIFRALEYCADEYNLYFKRRGVRYSLDDAMKFAVKQGWPFDPEVVRRAYNRCHTIVEDGAAELGERRDWLRLASDGGYPLAQVVAARNQFIELPSMSHDNEAHRERRRNQVAKAIRSRDPAVIWEIANVPLRAIDPEGDYDREHSAWLIAACQRGFDCSPQSEGVRWLCMYDRACQPYETVSDIFRRARADELPEIEARARWINEKIDAGDWEALGF